MPHREENLCNSSACELAPFLVTAPQISVGFMQTVVSVQCRIPESLGRGEGSYRNFSNLSKHSFRPKRTETTVLSFKMISIKLRQVLKEEPPNS